MALLLVLGCGYVGTRLAKRARELDRQVRVCARGTGRLASLAALGVEVKFCDVALAKQLPTILSGVAGGTVVYSVPPVTSLPPGRAVTAALQAAYGAGAECFIYFSSSGMYGDRPDDDVWIDEESPLDQNDGGMKNVQTDEAVVLASEHERMRTIVLRLAPVYGPGRGVRTRLRKGDYKLLDGGEHAISRIHVDDAVNAVFAAEAKGQRGSMYLVADDQPTTQLEYAEWLTKRMGLPMPGSRGLYDAGPARASHRNRKIRNTKIKTELGLELKYPTFKEGEAAIEAETGEEPAAATPATP